MVLVVHVLFFSCKISGFLEPLIVAIPCLQFVNILTFLAAGSPQKPVTDNRQMLLCILPPISPPSPLSLFYFKERGDGGEMGGGTHCSKPPDNIVSNTLVVLTVCRAEF